MSEEVKNWGEYKDALLEGLDEKNAKRLGVLFENAHKENIKATDDQNDIMVESTSPGSTTMSNISRYDMLFMPLIRRTMPSLVAMDLVGVQPLPGPRGIVRTLKKNYSQTTEDNATDQNVVVTAGDEASGENVYEKYSKLVLDGYYDDVNLLNPFEQSEYLEGNRGKPMNLEVLTDSIETNSRKLSAAYSLESADDLQSLDGLDMESELNQTLGDEIIREIDREIITDLNALPAQVEQFDFANVDGRYAGEKLAAMNIAIDNLSADIAFRTKKAGATWALVSQKVYTGMKNSANTTFVPKMFEASNNNQAELRTSLFVGTFSGGINVYVDPYAESDYITMGLKSSEIDAPMYYLPYISLASSGVVRNPETGDHRIMMRTRYATHAFTDPETSLGDAADHVARADVANIELGFKNAA